MAKTKLTKNQDEATPAEAIADTNAETTETVQPVETKNASAKTTKKKTKPKTKGKAVKAKTKKKTASKKKASSKKTAKKTAKKAKTVGKKASRKSKVTQPTRGNFFTTNIAIPVELVQKLDKQIAAGKFSSRSEFFREVGAKKLGVRL